MSGGTELDSSGGFGCACMMVGGAIAFAIITWAIRGFPGLAN